MNFTSCKPVKVNICEMNVSAESAEDDSRHH